MPEGILIDQKEREKIVQVLDKNFLVEAGAGSGKTTSLVQRMVALVSKGYCQAGEIAAITFTRKAAAELKERFQAELENKYKNILKQKTGDKLPLNEQKTEELAFLKKGLDEVNRCFTGTVHSFCARLLRERAVEAGIDPDFQEIDALQEEILLTEIWNDYLLETKLQQPELLKAINEVGIAVTDLKDSFRTLSIYPEIRIISEEVEKPDLKPALGVILEFCQEAVEYIPTKEPAKGYDQLQKKIRSILRLSKYLDLSQETNLLRLISILSGGIRVTLNRWLDKDQAREYRDVRAKQLKELTVNPILRQWREYTHYHLVNFLQPAVEYYQRQRQQESLLNFQDLLLLTASMLKNNSEVRAYFQKKYRCLLVDEFQDTDPIQAEIVFYLTGQELRTKNWTALTPIPGSLFVVGDPKQSIYRFRRADIDIYNLVKELILKSDGEVLELSSNFRSLQGIGDYLNPVFQDILPAEGNDYQAGYVPLNTVREDQQGRDSGVRCLNISNDYTKKEGVVERDAESIARIIKDAVDGGIKLARRDDELEKGLDECPVYGDFMILLRYKDSMEVYARKLEEYGIPVNMTGSSTLNNALEIKELYKLLMFLTDVDNQVLLTAVLRGLFFGLSDDDLYQYRNNGGNFNIYQPFVEEPSPEKDADLLLLIDKFKNAFSILRKFHNWTLVHPPTTTLEKIILDLGLLPFASMQEMARSRCGNIYYLLELMRKAECNGKLSFVQLVDEVTILMETTPETELNLTMEENTVRLMNLHKSKGLEAPVVFLAHPYKQVNITPDYHIKRNGGHSEGYFSFSCSRGWSKEVLGQPVDWERYQAEEQLYQDAEEQRLLYVAATRARNLLIVSSCARDKERSKSNNPWLELLLDRAEGMEIQIPEISKPVKKQGEIPKMIKVEDFQQKRRQFQDGFSQLAKPGYQLISPTDIKDGTSFFSIERAAGGGQSWGTAVHRVLEQLLKGTGQLSELIERILEEEGLALERKAELEELIKEFRGSSLWQSLLQADEVLTELPFITKIFPDDKLYQYIHDLLPASDERKEANLPAILSGVIDLLFKEQGNWTLVDYKTDRVKSKEDLLKLRQLYSSQLEIYSKVWEKISGKGLKEKIIYFLN